MSESTSHAELVDKIVNWIASHYAHVDTLCIFRDGPTLIAAEKPPMIARFVPDVFAEDTPATITIVGEAKTARDLDTSHSQRQIATFVEFLRFRSCPLLVVATPWFAAQTASNIALAAKQQFGANHVGVTII